jgi:uncharacterized protein
MKYLLIAAIVLIGYGIWRGNRQAERARERPTAKPSLPPQDMVRCPVCAVHLPRAEALAGRQALYCSHEHRRQAEG